MQSNLSDRCPDDLLAAALVSVDQDSEAGLASISELLSSYGRDPRLHFLRGSLLVSKAPQAAEAAMSEALKCEPGFAICRFQLGLLQLSSGNPAAAVRTWGPLGSLGESHPLRILALGLRRLSEDRFSEARELLLQGIALNAENEAVNADMQLLLDELDRRESESEPVSSAHQLLQQSQTRKTMH